MYCLGLGECSGCNDSLCRTRRVRARECVIERVRVKRAVRRACSEAGLPIPELARLNAFVDWLGLRVAA